MSSARFPHLFKWASTYFCYLQEHSSKISNGTISLLPQLIIVCAADLTKSRRPSNPSQPLHY